MEGKAEEDSGNGDVNSFPCDTKSSRVSEVDDDEKSNQRELNDDQSATSANAATTNVDDAIKNNRKQAGDDASDENSAVEDEVESAEECDLDTNHESVEKLMGLILKIDDEIGGTLIDSPNTPTTDDPDMLEVVTRACDMLTRLHDGNQNLREQIFKQQQENFFSSNKTNKGRRRRKRR